MIQLRDKDRHAININNVCAVDYCESTFDHAILVHGHGCRMSYTYHLLEDLEHDIKEMSLACKSYKGTTHSAGGWCLINVENVFSVDGDGRIWHFVGGFRNMIDFDSPGRAREFVMKNT